jgi:hypothetical protein
VVEIEEAEEAESILKRYNSRLQRLEKRAENIEESIENIKTTIKEKQEALEIFSEDFEVKEQELFEAGMLIMKLGRTAISLVRKRVSSSQAETISKELGEVIDEWLAKQSDHIIYGSLPASRQSFKARKPSDLDIAVEDPGKAAAEVSEIFKKKYKKPINIVKSPGSNRYGIQIKVNNEWVDAVDIHRSGMFFQEYEVYGKTLEPYEQNGLKIQLLTDQLLRKGNSVLKRDIFTGFGPLPGRVLKDTVDFINIARCLIESKEVRQLADIERNKNTKEAQRILREIENAKEALKIWTNYTKALPGYGKKYKIYSDAIPYLREKKFISYAKKHLDMPVKNLIFTNGNIETI